MRTPHVGQAEIDRVELVETGQSEGSSGSCCGMSAALVGGAHALESRSWRLLLGRGPGPMGGMGPAPGGKKNFRQKPKMLA
jgi:hypothetical protein